MTNKIARIGLLGTAFETNNRGVSALAEGSIKCILTRWPDAEITLLGCGRVEAEYRLTVCGRDLRLRALPIRFCKNVFLSNHFCVLFIYALLLKLLPTSRFRQAAINRNSSIKKILKMDLVADITGGDSFSDIYGMQSFILGCLRKWLVLLFAKNLVMLPQTYGPFKWRLAKVMARYILKKASLVYSRDMAGIEYVNKLLNDSKNEKVRFSPDVAFVLDSYKPERIEIEPSDDIKKEGMILVGLNISGLLYNGGFTGNNMFGLKDDYKQIIHSLINFLMSKKNVLVLLVPHVFAPIENVESDPAACLDIYKELYKKYPDRLFHLKGVYNQNEIKYIIGMCDFFIGSRMHACIAALSQCIPTAGIAYSRKFKGVFESIGVGNCVLDARNLNAKNITKKIATLIDQSNDIQEHLQKAVPYAKDKVLKVFFTPEDSVPPWNF